MQRSRRLCRHKGFGGFLHFAKRNIICRRQTSLARRANIIVPQAPASARWIIKRVMKFDKMVRDISRGAYECGYEAIRTENVPEVQHKMFAPHYISTAQAGGKVKVKSEK